jgi:hypothetical protein
LDRNFGALAGGGEVRSKLEVETKGDPLPPPVVPTEEPLPPLPIDPEDFWSLSDIGSTDSSSAYVVQSGDTLEGIARRHNLGPEGAVAIADLNGIDNLALIQAGASLTMPAPGSFDAQAASKTYGKYLGEVNAAAAVAQPSVAATAEASTQPMTELTVSVEKGAKSGTRSGEAPLKLDPAIKAQAENDYRTLEATVVDRSKKQPRGQLNLTADEKATLMNGFFYGIADMPVGDDLKTFMNDMRFADTFLYKDSNKLQGRVFSIEGESPPVEAGHLNYVAVGMMYAHYHANSANAHTFMPPLERTVELWNNYQIAEIAFKTGKIVTRDWNDIGPGTKYAKMGAQFYESKRQELLRNQSPLPK